MLNNRDNVDLRLQFHSKKSLLMKRTCILLLSVLFTLGAFAQQPTRSGTVSDENGKPLAGATVSIRGTKTSAVTGQDGKFNISVENGAVLLVSFTGYEAGTLRVSSDGVLAIRLSPVAAEIAEVVVTGTRGLPGANWSRLHRSMYLMSSRSSPSCHRRTSQTSSTTSPPHSTPPRRQ